MAIEVLNKMLSLCNYMAINIQISRNKLKLSYSDLMLCPAISDQATMIDTYIISDDDFSIINISIYIGKTINIASQIISTNDLIVSITFSFPP